ncbi:MAG: phosphoglycolate phosphatase [Proteobacteria bacterium]|nr:phosphoglycolate phosphatase [Pseudomonadota bacterium]
MFSTIAFDLDGTLIHSAPDVQAATNQALVKRGRRAITLDETKNLVGWGAKVLVDKALRLTGAPGDDTLIGEIQDDMLSYYAAHPVDHTRPFPGVIEVLDNFKARGIKLGICTNKPEKTAWPVLDALDMRRYFDTVVCGDTLPYRKPDGRHVVHVIETLGGNRSTGLMVGDSENDISAAIDAKIKSVAVTFGYAHKPHDQLGADVLIDDFKDLPAASLKIWNAMPR